MLLATNNYCPSCGKWESCQKYTCCLAISALGSYLSQEKKLSGEIMRGRRIGPKDQEQARSSNISRKSMIRDRGDLSPFGVLKRDN